MQFLSTAANLNIFQHLAPIFPAILVTVAWKTSAPEYNA